MMYNYPVRNAIEAIRVTEPDFLPPLEDFDEKLYVDFKSLRELNNENSTWAEMLVRLGIQGDSLTLTGDYTKIIFSGHKGCGKSVELRRLHQYLHHPDKYYALLINLEEDYEMSRFAPEDFFTLLAVKITSAAGKDALSISPSALQKLGSFFSQEKLIEELRTKHGLVGSVIETIADFKPLANALKNLFGGDKEVKTTIRETIKQRLPEFIQIFNEILIDFRRSVWEKELGKDLLFVLDGPEKIASVDTYDRLFVQDLDQIIALNLNMVINVRIDRFYTLGQRPNLSNYVLPMLNYGDIQVQNAMEEMLAKRIQLDTFFAGESCIKKCITYSGGCLRQLFRLVNSCINIATPINRKIDVEIVDIAINRLGNSLREQLTTKHIAAIKRGNFSTADEDTKPLLSELILLKYNGAGSIRINPALEKYMKDNQEL